MRARFPAPRGVLPGLALALGLVGCDLDEVGIPDGDDVLVAESILRSEEEVQVVLLHHTLRSRRVVGEEGALVRVTRGDGLEVEFRQDAARSCVEVDSAYPREGEHALAVEATCYVSPPEAGRWVVPGQTYELRVETVGGDRLRGRTTAPEAFSLRSLGPALPRPASGPVRCALPPDTPVELTWSRARGSAAYLTRLEATGLPEALAGRGLPSVPDTLRLYGVSVTERDTTIVVPTDIVAFEPDAYDRELMLALANGLPAGARVRLLVGALDANYVTAERGGGFNPSGAVRVSSVVGDGVGVFGSMVSHSLEVEVGGAGPACLPHP